MDTLSTVSDKTHKVLVPNLADGFNFDTELSLSLTPTATKREYINKHWKSSINTTLEQSR